MVNRFKELLEQMETTPSLFADEVGIARPVLSHILSGRNKPSLEVVQKVLKAYPQLNPEWLLFGEGEMMRAQGERPLATGLFTKDAGKKNSAETGNAAAENSRKVQEPASGASAVERIVIFYTDGSFSEHYPSGR